MKKDKEFKKEVLEFEEIEQWEPQYWINKKALDFWIDVEIQQNEWNYSVDTTSLLRTLDHNSVWGVDSSVKTVARVLETLIDDLRKAWILK